MGIVERTNTLIAKAWIPDFDKLENMTVRIRYGFIAGWFGICFIFALFVVKMILGLRAGSVSLVANAFHLLSHLANSIILVVSFKVTSRPATAKNPFGHGRMEHIAPLIMSIFLFITGIQTGETSLHQVLDPHELHYWSALPWILLASILVKQWLAQFVRYLGRRVDSHAILANAGHHTIEAIMTLAVIGGLIAGHTFHHPEIDGIIGIMVSAWLLFLGFTHAKEAIVPLLGKAPGRDIIQKIREEAKSVPGVEDVHEIIVHDYGSMYLISLHAEISEKLSPAEMHEITERAEGKLRKTFGGEAVCHTDPMMERTPEIQALEDEFKDILKMFPQIRNYHDFRVVAESSERKIIIADVDVEESVREEQFGPLSKDLEKQVMKTIPNIAYCSFYITPRFAY